MLGVTVKHGISSILAEHPAGYIGLGQLRTRRMHRGGLMNMDRVKGTIDEVAGSVKRRAGELTDDVQLQVEGMAQQVKGKVENTWGKAKDAVNNANKEDSAEPQPHV